MVVLDACDAILKRKLEVQNTMWLCGYGLEGPNLTIQYFCLFFICFHFWQIAVVKREKSVRINIVKSTKYFPDETLLSAADWTNKNSQSSNNNSNYNDKNNDVSSFIVQSHQLPALIKPFRCQNRG